MARQQVVPPGGLGVAGAQGHSFLLGPLAPFVDRPFEEFPLREQLERHGLVGGSGKPQRQLLFEQQAQRGSGVFAGNFAMIAAEVQFLRSGGHLRQHDDGLAGGQGFVGNADAKEIPGQIGVVFGVQIPPLPAVGKESLALVAEQPAGLDVGQTCQAIAKRDAFLAPGVASAGLAASGRFHTVRRASGPRHGRSFLDWNIRSGRTVS